MNSEKNSSGHPATVRPLQRAARAMVVITSLGLLLGLSFVFLPPGPREYGPQAALQPAPSLPDDPSPLHGLFSQIPGMEVRRLDRMAVVTFTYDVFDSRQNLLPRAREQLTQFALGLQSLHSRIAVEIAGYAPGASGADGYEIGLMRATRVATCLASAANLPPSSIALRSLGDTEIHGPADRPHAVVITISAADETSHRPEGFPVARL
jgi:hypothetical protein